MIPGRRTCQEFLDALTAAQATALVTLRPLSGKRVVITGKLAGDLLRETLVEHLEDWGATVDTAVRPTTDVLLAVDPERRTLKRREAARFGVEVLDEYGFTKWLHDALHTAEGDALRLAEYAAPEPEIPPPAWFVGEPGMGKADDFEDDIAPLGDLVAPETGKLMPF